MSLSIIEDQCYKGIDFTGGALPKSEYERCTFINCDFANTDLSDLNFLECEFRNCNLSMAQIRNTAFKTVHFIDSKLLGLHFDTCNTFLLSLSFTGCPMNLVSFYKLKMKSTPFKKCNLEEADFTEADLSGSSFDDCDLAGAIFDHTNLEKADFTMASNYLIDPEQNRMKMAKFSLTGIPGLLQKYQIEIW